MLYIGIPAYNEATTIGVLLWRLRSVLSEVSREYEVVVYDDASTDETAAALAPYSRVLPLTVLRGERRVGYAAAIDAIARHVARTTRYPRRDALLLLQGDFTDPPALVPEFLRRFEGGADLVIGERALASDAPIAVRRLWKAARWVLRPFVGITDVRDLTSSFRLVRIAVLRDMIKASGDAPIVAGEGWSANADFLLRAAPLARRVETIPVTPTFAVRTRDSRRTAWPDAIALARWGWQRRGDRVAVRVIARTVETVEVPDELLAAEATERAASPERRESVERTERTERPRRRERGGRTSEERPSGTRGAGRQRARSEEADQDAETSARPRGERSGSKRSRGRTRRERNGSEPTPELELGAAALTDTVAEGSSNAEFGESGDGSPAAEPRARRKRGRGRGERSAARAEGGQSSEDGEDGGAGGEPNEAAGENDPLGEDGAPRRRKRSRRGRRKRSDGGSASEASGGESALGDGGAAGELDEDGAPRRRRSRRGRRGGGRRRSESSNGEGGGASADDSGRETAGGASGGGRSPEGDSSGDAPSRPETPYSDQ